MGDIPDDDGPSPQDALGLNPLGTGPLGEGPLGPRPEDEEDDVTPEPETPTGETILQRHKVDRLLTGYNFSRERYQRDKKQWAIDALNAKRELKRKKRKEVDAPLGYAKIEYDKYAHTVNAGEAAFHQLLRSLEQQQAQRAALQARLFAQDAMARVSAAQALAGKRILAERQAQMLQFQRDAEEEMEAMELLEMMDD
jgi:hypothetical protein